MHQIPAGSPNLELTAIWFCGVVYIGKLKFIENSPGKISLVLFTSGEMKSMIWKLEMYFFSHDKVKEAEMNNWNQLFF